MIRTTLGGTITTMRKLIAVAFVAALTTVGAVAVIQSGDGDDSDRPSTFGKPGPCVYLGGGLVCGPTTTLERTERFVRQAPLPEGCAYLPGPPMANGEPAVSCIDVHPDEPVVREPLARTG